MRRQAGIGGVFLFAALLFVLIAIGAVLVLSRTSTAVQDQGQTNANLAKAAAALEQFASATGRLPCPARPDLDQTSASDGVAVPDAATVNCTYPQGTVPWRTIGMRRDDAFDAWGWKISYRVYSNVTGSMTQDQGVSMVNCDTAPTLGSAGVDANKLCRSTHATLPADFISGKGLTVTDFGTVYDGTKPSGGAAYVLISHGASGFGAYTTSGAQRGTPSSTDEKNNLKGTGPFTLEAASSPTVAPSASTHFDDVLLYRTVADLAKRANLVARDWPDLYASLTFNASTLQAALGQSSAPTAGSSLGTSSLNFGSAVVAAGSISGGSTNVSYDTAGGTEGIGAYGGGSGSAIAGTDYLTVTFAKSAGKVGISLAGFDSSERATLVFLRGGSFVGSGVTLRGCQSSTTGGGPLASFTVDPGSTFDEIGVTSWPYSSAFLLAAVKTCATTDSTCVTPLDNAGNHCS